MVCLACLLPLFLIPVVNALPLLFDYIMAKVYSLFGWEYRKPERAPPACPIKPPVAGKSNVAVNADTEPSTKDVNPQSVEAENKKCD